MMRCPVCSTPLGDPPPAECPECHIRLEGPTESFSPVGAPVDGEADVLVEEVTEGPALVVRKGPELGEKFFIDRPVLTIGRDPESDIFLNDVTVSRKHATLEMVGDVVSIEDAESLNGTYVNGVRIDKAPLADGDVVQVGTFQMLFKGGTGA